MKLSHRQRANLVRLLVGPSWLSRRQGEGLVNRGLATVTTRYGEVAYAITDKGREAIDRQSGGTT